AEETDNQAYEDDYAAYASLQSVTAGTTSPNEPQLNAVSAIDSNAKNTSAATADDRNVLAQEPNADATVTVTTPAHDTGTAETDSPSEPAEIQLVQQASPEPSAKDKPLENVVSATDNDAENTSSATTALRSNDTPETSVSDATGTQHTATTQPEEQQQVSMGSADDWSAFAEDLN
ncbi:DNA primase, partial [Escherichia coli]|nr:DNA primase [Escherichia coli]